MAETMLLDALRTIRFLEGITDLERQQLASVAQLEEYRPGAVVFSEGQRLARIFLVVEGAVALEIRVPKDGARRIQTVGPGELLGWSPVLDQTPMTATARALMPCRLIALDAAQVLGLCHHDWKFGFMFMRRTARALATRLNATRLQLLDVYHHELPAVAGVHEGAD
jgi:CRP/FNR family cyclic AMP-dependent transcriptional regulator